jgi:hypothetical protein
MDRAVDAGLAGVKQCGQRPGGQVVRRWISTSSARTDSGRVQGRSGVGGSRWCASVHTVQIWIGVSPVSGTRFRQRCGSGLMSVGDGFMKSMAATATDTIAAISGDVALPRRRGKSKAPNFNYEGPVSVIRLELDVSDARVLRRVEQQWAAVFRLQRDAQRRCRAYWAAYHERGADAKAVRERLGLSRKGIEVAAKTHIEASCWMRDHLTKAVGLIHRAEPALPVWPARPQDPGPAYP